MQSQNDSRFIWSDEFAQWALRPQIQQMSTWVRYEGPRGGKGWRNVETDEIRYQASSPSEAQPAHESGSSSLSQADSARAAFTVKPDEQYESFKKQAEREDLTLFGDEFRVRRPFPKFRETPTTEKIRKALMSAPAGRYGKAAFFKEMLKYKDAEQAADHLFFHGSAGYTGPLKPSIAIPRFGDNQGGGGYGTKYWGISVSKSKKTAGIFSGQKNSVSIMPVLLRRGAKVVDMNIDDALEIEDHIVELTKAGVDAVRTKGLQEKDGEQELIVLNPLAIVTGPPEYFQVHYTAPVKPQQPSDEEIKKMFESAAEVYATAATEAQKSDTAKSTYTKDYFLKKAARIKKLSRVGESANSVSMSTWAAYSGPRGGKGWRNTATGDIRYQSDMPEERGIGEPSQKAAPSKKNKTPVTQWAEDIFEDYVAPNGKKAAENFANWFGNSKVVTDDGEPLVLYHGTLKNVKDTFDIENSAPENFFGRGAYFSNTPADASDNYADREGPDPRNRIEEEIDKTLFSDGVGDDREKAEQIVKDKLIHHEGAVLPVFVKMENPFYYVEAESRKGDQQQTYWDYKMMDDESESMDDPTGTAVDFIEAVYRIGMQYHDDYEQDVWENVRGQLYEHLMDYGDGDSVNASSLVEAYRRTVGDAMINDDEGRILNFDILRQALQEIGHDGVIDTGAYDRWGGPRFTQRRDMLGMTPDTAHYVVFDSKNIKSATGNNGNFDDSQMISMATGAGDWVKYTGPRDGRGWKNIITGDVLYQDERPGAGVDAGRVALQVVPDKGFTPPKNIEELRKQHDAMMVEAESLDTESERARKESNEKSDTFQKQYEAWLAAGNKEDEWKDSELNDSIRKSLNEVWSRVSQFRDRADAIRTQASKLLIQHIPSRKEYANKSATSGFDTSLSYSQMVEAYGDERVHAEFDRIRDAQKEWESRIQYEISMGRITEKQAREHLEFFPDGHASSTGGYAPLPKKLWHITTAAGSVLSSSLKTRSELNQKGGAGLGGGPEDTISFTDNPQTAKEIYYAMLEGRRAALGEITVTEMIRAARDGRGAKQPYLEGICQYHNSNWKMGDQLPARVQGMLDYEERMKNSPESVNKTSAEHKSYLDDCMDVYKRFASYREWAGGVMDPAFVFNNTDLLREVNPDEIKILEINPKENTFGYKVSALGEWRAHTGDVVGSIFPVTPSDLSDSEEDAAKPQKQRLSTWTKYTGPRGGEGWKNVTSGEIRYQSDMPDAPGDGVSVPKRLAGPTFKGQLDESQAKRMKIKGTTEEITTCDYCGREDLKKTVVFELLDADGNGTGDYRHLGVDCASKMTKRKAKNITKEAEQQDWLKKSTQAMYDREKPLRIRPADDLNGANTAFNATGRHRGVIEIGELTKLRYDSKGNVVRVDLTDPDDVKWYEEHGFTLGSKPKTATKEFKEWFRDSKVVNPDGTPLVVYHGTLAPAFDEFRTNGDGERDWGMFDRLLGAHFAEDASVTDAFNSGEYAFVDNYHINEWDPERSWWKDKKGELHQGLPPLVLVDDGNSDNGWNRTIETYDPDVHGKLHQVKEKTGGKYLRPVHPGGRTVPVYLSIQNPLVIEPTAREMDQSAISRTVAELVFPENKQLFVDAVSKTGRDPVAAAKAWEDLKAGRSASLLADDKYDSFRDVARNFTGMLNGKEFTLQAKDTLKSLGYDGIKYKNTSNNEVKPGASPWAWIIFDDWQAKSSLANQGTYSRSTGKIGMSTREAYLI